MYKLRYKFFGFIFLQDMIDRGITEVQTNDTIDTGLFLQMFPYPCYIYDRFVFSFIDSTSYNIRILICLNQLNVLMHKN